MASSDDEGEVVPQSVTNYYFEDENGEPVSFSVLPILFDDAEKAGVSKGQVFLHGATDSGHQKVFKQVTAWKLGLQDELPEISVLSKDKKWIKLLKPRKIYEEETARTISITVHLLHFLRKKPESLEKSLWGHLHKLFSFENKASESDLSDHHALIKEFIARDDTLANCQLLMTFLEERPRKKISGEDVGNGPDAKKPFIADDDEMNEGAGDDDGDDSEEESDLFDSVCAICDNGGELICCEGKCLRSFHATRSAGIDSECKSLGYSRSQVEEIQNFLCKNCQYQRHQCFACGKLGSSDKTVGAEVFQCVNATCGYFYHPKCVTKLLYRDDEAEATEYQKKILSGESFTCPVHKCVVCDKGENKEVSDLQFAVCRRCPKSYHRQCLPKDIAFDDEEEEEEEDIIQRAWDDLLPNRILIYCLNHEIDEDLGTPRRNHIIFPEIPEKEKVVDVQKNKVLMKKKSQNSDNISRDVTSVKLKKVTEKLSRPEGGHSLVKSERKVTEKVLDSKKKVKQLKDSTQSDSRKADAMVLMDSKAFSKEKVKALVPIVAPVSAVKKSSSSFPVIDGETEKKIMALMQKVSSSLTLEDVIKKRTVPSTHAYSARHLDKSITHGKVEGSVEAIRAALKKVEDGRNVEDAKAVCEPQILKQLIKWSNKLRVYLSPFLHGVRYTSFGRHFTKVDKLIEIVDKLQWYVQNGDMIVDFCCGANDFSQLMKEKLESVGKKCSFQNYDVIQPKNDFCFEKRDWMTVQPRELPHGSKLIMGLNPPFGLKAALANKFIDKALTFNPKLVILIVPPETERLDAKSTRYDLIWEDRQKLSGKSFYLPGSVDVYDKQIEQWNNTPPVLSLWSHPGFASKHKAIALDQGHTSKDLKISTSNETPSEKPVDAFPPKEPNEKVHEKVYSAPPEKQDRREGSNSTEQIKKRPSPENHKQSSRKRRRKAKRNEDAGRRAGDASDMDISPVKTRDSGERSKDRTASEALEAPAEGVSNRDAFIRSGSEFGAVSGGGRGGATVLEDIDDIARRYTSSNRESLLNGGSRDRSGSGINGLDYEIRRSEERLPSYIRDDNIDTLGRKPYLNDYDVYRRSSYGMQGQEDLSQRSRFLLGGSESALGEAGRYSLPSFGISNSATVSSAMQRYAPRLDETNYSRLGNIAPSGPLPGSGSIYDLPGMRRDVRPDSMGFAPGPQYPFPGRGSSGWLGD